MTMDEYWTKVHMKNPNGNLRFPLMCKLIIPLLSIPNSNAETERVFSCVRKIHTCFRSQLLNDTLCKLLATKFNVDQECSKYKPTPEVCRKAKKAVISYRG